jgi:hypothetical protein
MHIDSLVEAAVAVAFWIFLTVSAYAGIKYDFRKRRLAGQRGVTGEPSRAALGAAAETTLAGLAIGGDDSAYGELVRRRQSWIRELLRRLCRDPGRGSCRGRDALCRGRLARSRESSRRVAAGVCTCAGLPRRLALYGGGRRMGPAPRKTHVLSAQNG